MSRKDRVRPEPARMSCPQDAAGTSPVVWERRPDAPRCSPLWSLRLGMLVQHPTVITDAPRVPQCLIPERHLPTSSGVEPASENTSVWGSGLGSPGR